MEWTVLSCLLLTSCVSIQAEPVASSRQENRSQYPDPAALLSSGQPQRVGALLLLKDYMTQGDTLLKDRLKDPTTSSAVLDELRRQMSGIQEELKSTKLQLHNT
ncbi:hypothetical protein ACOMHN_020074 [Nucella lapillus]